MTEHMGFRARFWLGVYRAATKVQKWLAKDDPTKEPPMPCLQCGCPEAMHEMMFEDPDDGTYVFCCNTPGCKCHFFLNAGHV